MSSLFRTSETKSTRRLIEGGHAVNARIAELVSSGAGVLAVCADASRRAALAGGASGLARFNGGAALVACHRCGAGSVAGLAARAASGLALSDYTALRLAPDLAAGFEHVVLVDPPPSAAAEAAAAAGEGYLHPLHTEAEREFALGVAERAAPSREAVAAVFRALRESGEAGGGELRAALAGPGPHRFGPEAAGRALRVLTELGLVAGAPEAGAGTVGVVSSEGTDLQRSAAFRAYGAEFTETKRFLERPKPL